MTDEERIARLRKQHSAGRASHLSKVDRLDIADRIEELVKERDALFHRATLAEEWRDHDKSRAEAAEAKLAKAVEALRETTQMLSQCTFTIIRMKGQYFERHEVVDKAYAVLAELEKTS